MCPMMRANCDRQAKHSCSRSSGTTVHRGYYRVIRGFLREIALMYDEEVKDQQCLFRATYLLKILDHFAAELPGITKGSERSWRSRALNPLLQRQLRGLSDQDSKRIRVQVGSDPTSVTAFYLTHDPLHPGVVPQLLRNLLYVPPVRWSLEHLCRPGCEGSYLRTLQNTHHILKSRAALSPSEFDSVPLCDFEVQLIRLELVRVESWCTPRISRGTGPASLKIFTSILPYVCIGFMWSNSFFLVYLRLLERKDHKICLF
jgi:hypothetical protein